VTNLLHHHRAVGGRLDPREADVLDQHLPAGDGQQLVHETVAVQVAGACVSGISRVITEIYVTVSSNSQQLVHAAQVASACGYR
jgi:hypothetical protein